MVALAVVLAGCPDKEIEVVKPGPATNDYAYKDLLAAVADHATKPVSPEEFKAFADRVGQLRPRFNEEIRELADMYLAFAALPVLQQQLDRPRDEQLHALALTVYPTAFGVGARDGESARDYLLRLCGEELMFECRDIVPEGWPVLLSAKVRRKMKQKAQTALKNCVTCADKAIYQQRLDDYKKSVTAEDAYAKEHESDYSPRAWAMSAGNVRPWSGAVVFALDGGEPLLAGKPLPTGSWVEPMADARGDARVLGVHLKPGARVDQLRAIAKDAAAAGYDELALQVRDRQYPYELGEYRISLARKGKRIDVRDIDTVQILARQLDHYANQHKDPPRL